MTLVDDALARHPELVVVGRQLAAAVEMLADCRRSGHVVYLCGNGGSAADAEHIVGELMKGMCRRRPLPAAARSALSASCPPELAVELGADAERLADSLDEAFPAVCLSSQSALLTAIANDLAGDLGFAQQVHGYARPGDVLWALSTSGRSKNVLLAALAARARGARVLALTGSPGRPLTGLADVAIATPGGDVAAVQELHRVVYHAVCRTLEEELFPRDER